LLKFDGEDFMATRKGTVSLHGVVSEIKKTIRQLEKIRRTATPANKKKLRSKIRSVKKLQLEAYLKCKRLSIWSPAKALARDARP
jgi:hypothetical protein